MENEKGMPKINSVENQSPRVGSLKESKKDKSKGVTKPLFNVSFESIKSKILFT